MPSEKNLRSIFSDIATEIREKLKNTDVIKPYNMADKIKEISSGVNFQILESYPTDFSLLDSKKCYTGFDKGKEFYVVFDPSYLIPLDSFFTASTGTIMPTPIFKVDTENDIPTSTMGFYYTNALDNMYLVIDGNKEVLAPISTTIEPNTVFAVDANVNRWILRYETYFGEKFKQFEFYAPKSNGPSIRMTSILSLDICNTLGINNKIYPIVVSFESISQDELSDKKYPNDVIYMYVNFNNQNGKVFLKTNNTVSIGIDDLSSSIFVNEAMYKYTEEDITTSINNGEQFFAVTNINEADSAYGWNTYQYKDKNITPENIKFGVNINGVTGTFMGGIDTSDATATANDILQGKTAYVGREKIEGVIETYADEFEDGEIINLDGYIKPSGNINITDTNEIDVSQYATAKVLDSNLTPENILKGITILGVEGTGGIDIAENIKVVSNSSDILSSEINKLYILNNHDINWKIVSKINGNLANLTTLDTILPRQKLGGSCCATYGNYIYIFGGVYLDDETFKMVYTNNIYKFDCTNQTIETISTTLPKNMAYASCVTYKNNIYIFGGYNASTNFSTIYKFNCTNERISTLSKTIPSRKYEKMSSVLYNDKIYLFGSFLNRSTNTKSDILIFNLANESWASTAYEKLPIYTMQPGSAVYNDNLYLFGGTDTVNGTTNTIYKFNLGNWTLTTLETTLPKSSRESSCFLFDDNIYILGGGYSDVHQFGCINEQITTLSVKCSFSNCGSIFKDYIYTFSDTKINKLQIPFILLKNNILIHSGDSSYSLDIIPEKVTLPVKNVYIGSSNNTAEFAKAYIYDETQSAWVNVNTGEVLTE